MSRPGPRPRALLVDAAGTLLEPVEPVARTYARVAAQHGVRGLDEASVARGFRRAFAAPWPHPLRYEHDGRPFWRVVVREATGSDDPELFEALYAHFARAEAWGLQPGLVAVLEELGRQRVGRALVSNWDTRLRGTLEELGVTGLFDALCISAEVGVEKPDPAIFHHACEALGVAPREALHVGDSRGADIAGAEGAGLLALHWQGAGSLDDLRAALGL